MLTMFIPGPERIPSVQPSSLQEDLHGDLTASSLSSVWSSHPAQEILRSMTAIYTIVNALHLLSGTVSIDQSFTYLQHARQTIESFSRRYGDTAALEELRVTTGELDILYRKERVGKAGSSWPNAAERRAKRCQREY